MRKRQPSDWAATVMVVDVAVPARSSEALPFVWTRGNREAGEAPFLGWSVAGGGAISAPP